MSFTLTFAPFFNKSEIITTSFHDLKNAYPVLNQSNKLGVEKTMAKINKIENLESYGRSGNFSYVHLHDIFKFAKNSIDDYVEIG